LVHIPPVQHSIHSQQLGSGHPDSAERMV